VKKWRLEKYFLKSPIFLLKEGFFSHKQKKRELVLFSLSWSQSEQHPLMHPVGWIVYGHETRLDGWMVCEQKKLLVE
jgi:hypothetical protein